MMLNGKGLIGGDVSVLLDIDHVTCIIHAEPHFFVCSLSGAFGLVAGLSWWNKECKERERERERERESRS